ncbi:Thiolase, N-terminal domain-containing protein [Mycotypha africana]|uniref:Thiolase, N-terminal domain-containing protein n=1 Tax=Mycotypha africana TaxID=64632 RepID=UPI002301D6C3|nr:Thiolase, N-terminal domain-containing protein [Mycotypha africana]KAI8984640.1 Thiolase, N-terminal domain-containing protein [Mycotypha africana]
MTLRQVFIVAAKRTPFGAFGGKLKDLTASELGGLASRAAIADLPNKDIPIDSVIFGNVLQTDVAGAYVARHIGHRTGLPVTVPALTVNRLCGSGLQSLINAAQEIQLNEAEIVLAGGTENMSLSPFSLSGSSRWGLKLGQDPQLKDTLWTALTDQYPTPTPMGITAENLAEKYNISKDECDNYALSSQNRYEKASKGGIFKDEITPVEIKGRKGPELVSEDEHPRFGLQLEHLTKLKPVFKKGGVVSAANASGINDGAAALIVASEDAVNKYNLKPLARIVSWQASAVEPTLMGLGPVPSIQGALKRAKLNLQDMNLIEVNEAFAAQYLACEKELRLDRDKTNVNGGAIAVGHPLGASGARILTHLSHALQRTKERYAVGSACIGGGQGVAVILERV